MKKPERKDTNFGSRAQRRRQNRRHCFCKMVNERGTEGRPKQQSATNSLIQLFAAAAKMRGIQILHFVLIFSLFFLQFCPVSLSLEFLTLFFLHFEFHSRSLWNKIRGRVLLRASFHSLFRFFFSYRNERQLCNKNLISIFLFL